MGLSILLSRLAKVKQTGTFKWQALCPAHPDKQPSLTITDTDTKVLVHCHAGCDFTAILDAVALEPKDLFKTSLLDAFRRQNQNQEEKKLQSQAILALSEAKRKRGEKLSKDELALELKAYENLNGC